MSIEEYKEKDPVLQPFLEKDRSSVLTDNGLHLRSKGRRYRRWDPFHVLIFIFLQIVLLVLYTSVFFSVRRILLDKYTHPNEGFFPIQNVLVHQELFFDKYAHLTSPYAEPPGTVTDTAWHDLLAGMNIRVSGEELLAYNTTSVRIADGSGYIAQLGVYHELHCLKKLKHWVYKDHYLADLTAEDLREERFHLEHCIEWIRTAALCRGDTTLTTFAWNSSRLETVYPIPHRCVDSDGLLEWSRSRAVDIGIPGTIEGPL